MDPSDSGGPDGSSLKPVSSLRSHFENMNKPTADQPQQPQQQQQQPPHVHPPPIRAVSPAPIPSPKPDRLRDLHKEHPAAPKHKPKDPIPHPPATLHPPQPYEPGLSPRSAPRSPQRSPFPAPPLSPHPVRPPSLLIEPPQSPPKGRSLNVATADHPSYLNPDAVVKSASPATTPRQFKIPSRPHTPVLEPRRSPRLSASQPPSPPPPRRSAELRREREPKPTLPPPVNRFEKPPATSRASWIAENGHPVDVRNHIPDHVSPFNSPPSSGPSGDELETPPSLPTRPRPHPAPLQKTKTIPVGFDPPPLHHSIATKRKEKEEEINGIAKGRITPHVTGDQAPALPARPRTIAAEQPLVRNETHLTMPPPRPPRPGIVTAPISTTLATVPQKRVVSTPTTQQHPPPPVRSHGRSMTVTDRSTGRAPHDIRQTSIAVSTPTESRSAFVNGTSNAKPSEAGPSVVASYPDTSNINRRPPFIKQGASEISMKYDSRVFDVCGELVCATGHLTRVWSLLDGELLMSFAHGEGVKATSVAFKPGANVDEEGQRLWIGNNIGDLMEADIATQSIVSNKQTVHGRHEIIKIYRHFNELWTLDDGGTLHVWGPDSNGVPNMANNSSQSYRLPRNHGFSMVVGDELWHATGKEIRVFLPTVDGRSQFQVLMRPLYQDGAGDVTSGTFLASDHDKVFFGHNDGKVSIYSRKDYSCLSLLSISTYKINTLAGVGDNIWAGFNTGKICVYDVGQSPWVVLKDWQGHDNPVLKLILDQSSFYKLDRRQVVSLGADNMVKSWDGMLQEDWLESEMKTREAQYCEFHKLKALIMTWNAGASTPNSLRYSDSDATFIQNLLLSGDSPDIIVFGFQELVDLEDKTATAKRFLKPKKKEGTDQERMSHQYRDWLEFLVRSLDDFMPNELYHLLQTSHLVGLFTCIFVKADLRERITSLSDAEVKRGMGGLHGNKGAIAVRFKLDDSSLCFVNCHLAAGQSQATHRHNDIAAILEANILPIERDATVRLDSFVGGGDGTQILDHELCILNGDLNYRIDTMSRDTVVAAVKANNLGKLLERDQLLVARRRNPLFRLRAFEEMPITFPPTYKYDVGTDNYDSSEKKRSPAWCDRLLYRAGIKGRIQQLDYRRHEVRVSDHRPVSGRFHLTVKRVVPKNRATVWMECQQQFEDLKERDAQKEKLYYLTHVIGYDAATGKTLIEERSGRRARRSPSRHRE
ncbi:Skeletal muscle and kidney-enriched inositol phosphatase [Pleurostoma richardsiae]|uniref:Skeletal muscle and kidney-enriched inositol phosphatase n=1 Tax=Pleurostoma richardsiae TaxID=41990 RepID=A0AA38RAT3_9PEZI|nr:Skeletal muscle and kidney-enriched inositol phosphatase [Pleurostoma richardsiae]